MARCRHSPVGERLLTRHSADDALVRNGLHRPRQGAVDRRPGGGGLRRAHGPPDPEARALSGGNLQKFVVGRELDRKPTVLVVNQPTWGVDAGAAAVIRQALIDLARAGSAVLVISQDLDEIFEIADRIAVISRGHLSDAQPAARDDMREDRPADGRRGRSAGRRRGTGPGGAACGSCLKGAPSIRG